MTFFNFANYLQKLEKLNSRLEMTYLLADLFKKLKGEEIKLAVYLMQGKLVPKYESLEFNLSVKMLIRALTQLAPENKIKNLYKDKGDLGLVAENIMGDKNLQNFNITQIHTKLAAIAKDSGTGSQERKINNLVKLLKQVDSVSAKYIIRVIIGKLRLGFSTMTIIDSLSWVRNKSKVDNKILESAYQTKADLGQLAQDYLNNKNIKNYQVKNGIPVMPALCQRLNSATEIIKKLNKIIAEPKYDGLRTQIHVDKKNKQINIFTRNLDNINYMFPEAKAALDSLDCQSCILDAEAIGYDAKTGKLVEFQQTVTRRRKHAVSEQASKMPIKFYVFDLLELNGQTLIKQGLLTRKKLLNKIIKKNKIFFKTKYLETSDPAELHAFHEQQLKNNLEGAVIKKINSQYVSGRKGWNWVKIKEAEGKAGKLSDTLDCIVMGYYFGRGKRAQFGIGAILVGVLDEKTQEIKTIAKIGTGISDAKLKLLKTKLDKIRVSKDAIYRVSKNLVPDVYVEPKLVVEIAADEITKSPSHSAGVALRFPRLVKIRNDKNLEQATTISELKNISHLKS